MPFSFVKVDNDKWFWVSVKSFNDEKMSVKILRDWKKKLQYIRREAPQNSIHEKSLSLLINKFLHIGISY